MPEGRAEIRGGGSAATSIDSAEHGAKIERVMAGQEPAIPARDQAT